jgi:eukaryotic-like serine/threonine-protein kinase
MGLEIGQRVGEYEILALLGAGGMGQVYSARNIISGRVEAMKVLLPDFDAEPEIATRFTVEIRTLAALDHPNIAQLRTAFEYENQLVMIMEFVEGTTLEKLPGARPMLVSNAITYSTQVLAALTYAHSKGVTHRDIKPANIMITSHGLVKLMDFGIAKSHNDPQLTRPGTTVGSLYYMSPEQVRGDTVDARSDIYSFGVTLYQMLTGRRPFQGESAYSVLTAQLNEAPVPPAQLNPTLPAGLNEVVLRAMSKAPEARFQSAEEFRQALLKAQQGSQSTASMSIPAVAAVPPPVQPLPVPPMPPPLPAAAPQKSHRGLWLGLGAAAAIIAIIAAATLLPHFFATQAGQKSGASVTEAPAPSPSSGGGTAGATSNPPAESPAPNPPPKDSAIAKTEAAPSQQNQSPQPPTPPIRPAYSPDAGKPGPVAADPTPPGPTRQEIAQARERMIQLDSKAEAARSSIEQLRSQQQAQGLGLRGDIAGSLNRMNAYISEANRSLNEGDIESANANMDRAEKELSTLETFLGR